MKGLLKRGVRWRGYIDCVWNGGGLLPSLVGSLDNSSNWGDILEEAGGSFGDREGVVALCIYMREMVCEKHCIGRWTELDLEHRWYSILYL